MTHRETTSAHGQVKEGPPPQLRTELEDAEIKDILDRVLDGCISFDPLVRIQLSSIDLQGREKRVVVAPERRKKRFMISR